MKNRKHIYLMRHAESRANIDRVAGEESVPLTEEGIQQARLVAERFKKLNVLDVVLTSHYKRAQQTAHAIASACNVPMETIEMAHEREVPKVLADMHKDDPRAKKLMKEFHYGWMSDDDKEHQGEDFNALRKRVIALTAELESREEQHIAVVSHGFFLKFFVAHHLLGPHLTPEIYIDWIAEKMRMSNTGITYFTVDEENRWQMYVWSDFSHLQVWL